MPPHRELQKALDLLLQAREYAEELDRDAWDFAVELKCLREAGLTNNDVRWLMYQGFLVLGTDVPGGSKCLSRQQEKGRSPLHEGDFFLLSEHGYGFAIETLGETYRPAQQALPNNGMSQREASPSQNATPAKPQWDSSRRTLVYGKQVVKEFKSQAVNQEIVLAAFEEEEWQFRIDDPLPQHPDIVGKQRLHDTISSLNRNQKRRLLRFRGDGTGEGICWEPCDTV